MASLGAAPTLEQVLAALPADDSSKVVVHVYDDAGHLLASVDGTGHVTVSSYDENGQLKTTTSYILAMTSAQQSALGDQPTAADVMSSVTPFPFDMTTYQLHDAAGNLLAEVDSLGHVLLMSAIESEFGVEINIAASAKLTSFESVELYLTENARDRSAVHG